jgi:small-conductance mechanosensitive channel
MLLQQQSINYSGLNQRACSIEAALTYEHNRKRIETLLLQAANKTNQIIAEPAPLVLLKRLDR